MRSVLIFLLSLPVAFVCRANLPGDTTSFARSFDTPPSQPAINTAYLLKNEWIRQGIAPAFLLSSAFLTWGERENVRKARNRYVPEFSNHLDDYMQYAPAMAVAGLSLSGKKGRNGWKRQTLSWGGSMLIMGGFVNSIKYTSKVMRPDGTTRNSFPSGHTATAFMNASFLHREYGHINPWYSIAGYASSAYVGVSRSLNNRHWISDILAGAAFGILSTELSYAIIDELYKNKGDYFSGIKAEVEIEKPSYFSVRMGYSIDLGGNQISSLGLESTVEGAYYFNKHWGIGGEVIFGNYPFPNQSWEHGDLELPDIIIRSPQQDLESAGFIYLMAGPQYAKHLGSVFLLQAKVIAGTMIGLNGDLNLSGVAENKVTGQKNDIVLPFVEYIPHTCLATGAGISLTAMMTPRLGLSLFADYKYAKPAIDIIPSQKTFGDQLNWIRERSSTTISDLSTGLRFTVFLH